MSPPFLATPASIRAALATAAFDLEDAPPIFSTLGPLTLRPHQLIAAARLRRALHTHRGALLADAVGLGKTWVALALVRDAHTPVVVAPAALRPMWRHAAATAGVRLTFRSTESFSAPTPPVSPSPPDLVVVDEAHHFRTPGTRRRTRLAALCAHTPVLLLSATPVHNTARDLVTLLSLFLGEHAATLDSATLAHLVVRRRSKDLRATHPTSQPADPPLPHVARPQWSHVPAAQLVRRALLALPPPLPPADGGHAPTLATLTLVRLWASSDAALRTALRRRLTRAAALAHALAAGRHPDRRTLTAWTAGDGALQLPLFLDGTAPPNAPALASYVEAHAAAVRRTLAVLDAAAPADPARVAWLQAVRARHPGARVVAFTQFADTARAVFRALAPGGHTGLLTAAGGRIASGPLSREAVLARFAPRATGAPDPPAIERIDCLVTTDCLSEGLDLRDASVVVHLDIPWTPARLAQRVGRAARLGTPHATVHVYGLRPDPATARWLRLARRLRAKARAARHALGAHGHDGRDGPVRGHMAVHRQLERWLAAGPPVGPARTARALHCGRTGFVAVYHANTPAGTPPVLVAALGPRGPTTAPAVVRRALRHLACDGAAVVPPGAALAAARAAVHAWARRRTALAAIGAGLPPALTQQHGAARHPASRAALARADAALRAAPPHARAGRALAAGALRDALAQPLSAGAEHALAGLPSDLDHDAWLADALAAVTPQPHTGLPPATTVATWRDGQPGITALVLLLP